MGIWGGEVVARVFVTGRIRVYTNVGVSGMVGVCVCEGNALGDCGEKCR